MSVDVEPFFDRKHDVVKDGVIMLRTSKKGLCNMWSDHFWHKKGKRKVQGEPQSQTAALPRHQKEEETDKTKQTQIEQTHEKH